MSRLAHVDVADYAYHIINHSVVRMSIFNTDSLNIRNRASVNGSKVTTVSRGSLGTVIAGPTVADGHNWWHVSYDNGSNGWSAGDWLTKEE